MSRVLPSVFASHISDSERRRSALRLPPSLTTRLAGRVYEGPGSSPHPGVPAHGVANSSLHKSTTDNARKFIGRSRSHQRRRARARITGPPCSRRSASRLSGFPRRSGFPRPSVFPRPSGSPRLSGSPRPSGSPRVPACSHCAVAPSGMPG